MLKQRWDNEELKYGGEEAVTVIETEASADTRPLESVTVALKVIVPELLRKPVVSVEAEPLYPPPVME